MGLARGVTRSTVQSSISTLLCGGNSAVASNPRDIYLEAVNPTIVQDWFSDIWGLSLGGGVVAGLRPSAGDTVIFSGVRCNVRLTADSPFLALIRHNEWLVQSNEGLLFINDGCTLKVGNGTNAIISDATPGVNKGMYIQNQTTSETSGTGAVQFAGGFDFGTGACVANSIRLLNSGTCDYISPEGTNPCTITIDPSVIWQNDLKDQIIGNAGVGNNITNFTMGSDSTVQGSEPFSFTYDANWSGSGTWTCRVNASNAAILDITGFSGTFSPNVLELGGSGSDFIFNEGQSLSGIGQITVTDSNVWEPIQDFSASLIVVNTTAQVDLTSTLKTITLASDGIVLQGSKTTGAGAAIVNTEANPVVFSGAGVQQVRGTSNIANSNYWGHIDQTNATGQIYLRDTNPSFATCKVTGELRVSSGTIPEFSGDLTLRSGAVFFNGGSWSGMGFKCNDLTLNGQSLSSATLTIRGTGTAAGGTFTNVNCGSGNTLTVTGGTDGGGNTNVTFI